MAYQALCNWTAPIAVRQAPAALLLLILEHAKHTPSQGLSLAMSSATSSLCPLPHLIQVSDQCHLLLRLPQASYPQPPPLTFCAQAHIPSLHQPCHCSLVRDPPSAHSMRTCLFITQVPGTQLVTSSVCSVNE